MTGRAEELRLFAVDAGTSGLRAVAFDVEGRIVAEAEAGYDQRHVGPAGMEQDAGSWLAALEQALPVAVATAGGEPGALAVTSQRATIIPLDAASEALHPAILWRDKRSLEQCRRLEQAIGEDAIHRRTGLRLDPYFSLPKIMWLRDVRPDVAQRTRWLVTVHDLLVHHLTGRVVTEWTQASRTLLLDVEHLRWDADLAAAGDVDPAVLPDLEPPGSIAGGLLPAVAERVGLPAGLPVVMAGGDQQSAAVGLGVVAPGQAEVTTGSGAFVLAPVPRPLLDPERRVLCSAAAVPATWVLEGSVLAAMSAHRWLRERLMARGSGVAGIDEALSASPPGSRGVIALAHLAGRATPTWEPAARGVLFGLGLEHDASDATRAMLEAVVAEAAACLAAIGELTPDSLTEVRASGSAAASDRFNQLQADAYGLRVVPARTAQATALGAAIQAAVAVGLHPDVPAAAAAMTPTEPARACEPRPEQALTHRSVDALRDALHGALRDARLYDDARVLRDRLAGTAAIPDQDHDQER